MANTKVTHPRPERLAAYRRGRLVGAEAQTVEEHLEGCAVCRTLLASLSGKVAVALGETPTASYQPAGQITTAPGAVQSLDLPERFAGYRVERLLGRGGMGSVYLAHDERLGRAVALKVPRLNPGDGAEGAERFRREARAAATIEHPGVCPVYEVGEVDGVPYLAMRYIEGKSLAETIKGGRSMPQRQAAALAGKIALAISAAHQKGVVHRDLKPANIMMANGREPVVMDFGLARRTSPGDVRLTQSGMILGTPAYMAPEQVVADSDKIGPVSDVYALGVILYELLTGRLPFEGPAAAVLGLIQTTTPPSPAVHKPDLDPRLVAICQKAMAREPAGRFASMSDMASALLGYVRSQAPAADNKAGPSLALAPAAAVETYRVQVDDTPVPVPPPPADAPRTAGKSGSGRRKKKQKAAAVPAAVWIAAGAGGAALLAGAVVVAIVLNRETEEVPHNSPVVSSPAPPPTKREPAKLPGPAPQPEVKNSPAGPPDVAVPRPAVQVTQVIRAWKVQTGDGNTLTANDPQRDVAVLLKIESLPAHVTADGLNLFRGSYVLAGGEKRAFHTLTVSGTGPVWAAVVIRREVRTLTLQLPGLPAQTVNLPETVVNEAKVDEPAVAQSPQKPLSVRLAMFGPARYENDDFGKRTLTGVIVEVEGKAAGAKGRFDANSVTARAGARLIPAAVVFTAGGREGLVETAQLLANSKAEAGDIYLGTSRFTSWPVGSYSGPSPRNAKITDAATGRVRVPLGSKEFTVGDFMLAMPLVVEGGGGVDFGFALGKTVRLGFLFEARAEDVTEIRLLGSDLKLEAGKRLGEPLPGKRPAPQPGPPFVVGDPPGPGPTPAASPKERAGWWAVPVAGGEPRLVVANRGHLATAVSRDLKRIAVYGAPTDEELAKAKGKAVAALRVAVGEQGKPLRSIWKLPDAAVGQDNIARLRWSPGGQRLLLTGSRELLVVDLKGKGRYLAKGSVVGALFPGGQSSRWVGRGDTDVVMLSTGFTANLVILNVLTGQPREQIPVPKGIGGFGQTFDITDDLSTAAVPITPVGPQKDAGGLWIWRRAQRNFVQFVEGYIDRFALSPGGKYLAVTTNNIRGNIRTTSLYEISPRRLIWSVPRMSTSGFAFDPSGKRLAISTGNNQLLVTGIESYEPAELVRGASLGVREPTWSADGRQILFRLSGN